MTDTSSWSTAQWAEWFEAECGATTWALANDPFNVTYPQSVSDQAFARSIIERARAGISPTGAAVMGQELPEAFARLNLADRQAFFEVWMGTSGTPTPPDREPPRRTGLLLGIAVVAGALVAVAVVALSGGDGDAVPTSTVAEDIGPVTTITSAGETSDALVETPLTTVPQSVPAASVVDAEYVVPHTFVATMGGDGESMAFADSTKWYIVEIRTVSSDGMAIIAAEWGRGSFNEVTVTDEMLNRIEADATAQWTSPSTIEVGIESAAMPSPVDAMTVTIIVRTLNPDGSNGEDYESVYEWPG